MIAFHILKQSNKSHARLGVLKTPHGEVETPAFVPVATQATVKGLMHGDVARTGTQILIANTYHLHLRPGEKMIKAAGGLHKFMAWDRPLMTDSGGFQVFSLGFGKDLGTGKLGTSKERPSSAEATAGRHATSVEKNRQPQFLKITEQGV